MSGPWRLALRNLRRNRRRNVATALAIALGYAGLSLLGGYAGRVEQFLRNATVYLQHTGHVAVWKKGGLERALARPAEETLTRAEQERIAAALAHEPGVQFAGRYLRGMGLVGNGCRSVPFLALGIEPDALRRVVAEPAVRRTLPELVEPVRGRPLSAYVGVPGAVGLSTGLARRLGKERIHDELPKGADGLAPVVVPDCGAPDLRQQLAGDANVQLAAMSYEGALSAVDGEVVDIFHTPSADTEDQTVHAPLALLQRLYGTDRVTYVAVYLDRAGDASRVARDLAERFAAERLPLEVWRYDDPAFNPAYAGAMAFIRSLVGFITVLVAAVVTLGVLNAMTLTALERTREIGTFRALGWRRRQLVALFLREGALLASVGLLGGLVLALAVAYGVEAANIRFSPPGIPGTLRLVVTPGPGTLAGIAALFLPLVAVATALGVRLQVRRTTADLLTIANA